MALDIREGDRLVVGSDTYIITEAHNFDVTDFLTGGSYGLKAVTSCSTQRKSGMTGTTPKGGVWTNNLTGLLCTPIDPHQPELSQAPVTATPYRMLQTQIQSGADMAWLIMREDRR